MPEKILSLLKIRDSFVSGEEISKGLGITRAAVWKKILALKKKGFVIHAVPSKGYRLVSSPELSKEYLLSQLQGEFWKDILIYASLDSTNDLAMSLCVRGEISPGTVLIADRQLKGKGRLGRTWESPPGVNVYMSIVLRPDLEPKDAAMLTCLTAVSCATALRQISGLDVSIKWPNDLMVASKKVGGILSEVRADPDSIHVAVIGIGVNVNMEKRHFPAAIADIATSLKEEAAKSFTRNEIIIAILKEFENGYHLLRSENRHLLIEKWRNLSSTLNRKIRVVLNDGTLTGLAVDVDEKGMLVLQLPSGDFRKISAGDITFIR
jgi:BirA family biotin operon repressor/biotin-[acetyl-CoA-carboxylase] ligase